MQIVCSFLLQWIERTLYNREDEMWGEGQQEVKMSYKKRMSKKELEEVGNWEIFETTQCLLSVRLLSVAHLRLKKDTIVQASSEVLCLELQKDS